MDYNRIAHLYDAYVRTEFDIPFFLGFTQGCESVLELMCGTGRVSIPLLKAGVPLTCVDSSPEMLARLHGKLGSEGLFAPVHQTDVCAFDLKKRFERIIIPFHAFAEIVEPEDQSRALASIRRHLADDGLFICTLHNPAARLRSVDGQLRPAGKHARPGGGFLFLFRIERYAQDTHRVTGTQFYEEYDRLGVLERKSHVDTCFHLHTREGFQALVRSHGFAVEALYGDYGRSDYREQDSPFMLWVLRKEGTPDNGRGDMDARP
jgi:SAM-dependent methyltransferase